VCRGFFSVLLRGMQASVYHTVARGLHKKYLLREFEVTVMRAVVFTALRSKFANCAVKDEEFAVK